MEKIDLADQEFEVLPPETKVSLGNYYDAPAVKALFDGRVIRVEVNTAISKMYRYARTRGYQLHKRKTPEGLVLWLERVKDSNVDDK